MEIWEEVGLTREEYEEAMEEAAQAFGWGEPPTEAEMCGMYIERIADMVREYGDDLNLEQYIEVLKAYDDMLTLKDIAPDDYERQLQEGGDFEFIEKTLKMDIPEMSFIEHRDYWEIATQATAMMQGYDWDELVEYYGIDSDMKSARDRKRSGIDYSKLPEFIERDPELRGPKTQRQFESYGHDSRVLNSIENGRSNPDFDFDEYDDDEDDISYGDY